MQEDAGPLGLVCLRAHDVSIARPCAPSQLTETTLQPQVMRTIARSHALIPRHCSVEIRFFKLVLPFPCPLPGGEPACPPTVGVPPRPPRPPLLVCGPPLVGGI